MRKQWKDLDDNEKEQVIEDALDCWDYITEVLTQDLMQYTYDIEGGVIRPVM